MAIDLQNKTNVIAPGGDYPYGDIKDDPGDESGTPVDRNTYADFHQFFARLLRVGNVVANGLRENAANGWQYITALQNYILGYIQEFNATQSQVNTGTDDQFYVTSKKLKALLDNTDRPQITSVTNNVNAILDVWTVTDVDDSYGVAYGAGSVGTVSGNITWKLNGKTLHLNFYFTINPSGTATALLFFPLPNGMSAAAGTLNSSLAQFDTAPNNMAFVACDNTSQNVNLTTKTNFPTSGTNLVVRGSITLPIS